MTTQTRTAPTTLRARMDAALATQRAAEAALEAQRAAEEAAEHQAIYEENAAWLAYALQRGYGVEITPDACQREPAHPNHYGPWAEVEVEGILFAGEAQHGTPRMGAVRLVRVCPTCGHHQLSIWNLRVGDLAQLAAWAPPATSHSIPRARSASRATCPSSRPGPRAGWPRAAPRVAAAKQLAAGQASQIYDVDAHQA